MVFQRHSKDISKKGNISVQLGRISLKISGMCFIVLSKERKAILIR